jgi:hypothetical protein
VIIPVLRGSKILHCNVLFPLQICKLQCPTGFYLIRGSRWACSISCCSLLLCHYTEYSSEMSHLTIVHGSQIAGFFSAISGTIQGFSSLAAWWTTCTGRCPCENIRPEKRYCLFFLARVLMFMVIYTRVFCVCLLRSSYTNGSRCQRKLCSEERPKKS